MVFSEVLNYLWGQLCLVLRPMLKWILHKVTGKCELLRITYEEPQHGAKQTKRIEKSLGKSRNAYLKQLAQADRVDAEDAVRKIVQIKAIVLEVHGKFEETLQRCLVFISGYNRLMAEVEGHRSVKFSHENPEHEARLLQLWHSYMPDTKLEERISDQWGQLGFQGKDPATDFRGMGILGLDQLLYFAEKYSTPARNTLSKALHPMYGFSFAIVGINITEMQYKLMMKRKLRTHFYNLQTSSPTIDTYHEVYCYLLFEFTKFWINEKPKDIMEFSRVRDKFKRHIIHLLRNAATVLRTEFQAES